MPKRKPTGNDQQKHERRHHQIDQRCDDQQPPPIHAIRDNPHEGRCDITCHLATGNDTHPQRGIGQLQRQPADHHHIGPPRRGGKHAGRPKHAEAAMAQGL